MKPFRLMDLPAEIRNQIYADVLVEEQAIFIDVIRRFNGRRELCRINAPREHKYRGKVFDRQTGQWKPAPPTPAALLRVSKAVYKESLHVLYSENTFKLESTTKLTDFLKHLQNKDLLLSVQHLQIKIRGFKKTSFRETMKLLSGARKLVSLEIEHHDLCAKPTNADVYPIDKLANDVAVFSKRIDNYNQDTGIEKDATGIVRVVDSNGCSNCSNGENPTEHQRSPIPTGNTVIFACGCVCADIHQVVATYNTTLMEKVAARLAGRK